MPNFAGDDKAGQAVTEAQGGGDQPGESSPNLSGWTAQGKAKILEVAIVKQNRISTVEAAAKTAEDMAVV